MAVLAVLDDLLFRSKIEAAAAHLGVGVMVVADLASLRQQLADPSWRSALIDLDLASEDPIAAVGLIRQLAPALPVVGFGSHVHVDLLARAQQAGCTRVCSRSAFVRGLHGWLTGVGISEV